MSAITRQIIGEEGEEVRRIALAALAPGGILAVDAADLIHQWMAAKQFDPGCYTVSLQPAHTTNLGNSGRWVLDMAVAYADGRFLSMLKELNRFLNANLETGSSTYRRIEIFSDLRRELYSIWLM